MVSDSLRAVILLVALFGLAPDVQVNALALIAPRSADETPPTSTVHFMQPWKKPATRHGSGLSATADGVHERELSAPYFPMMQPWRRPLGLQMPLPIVPATTALNSKASTIVASPSSSPSSFQPNSPASALLGHKFQPWRKPDAMAIIADSPGEASAASTATDDEMPTVDPTVSQTSAESSTPPSPTFYPSPKATFVPSRRAAAQDPLLQAEWIKATVVDSSGPVYTPFVTFTSPLVGSGTSAKDEMSADTATQSKMSKDSKVGAALASIGLVFVLAAVGSIAYVYREPLHITLPSQKPLAKKCEMLSPAHGAAGGCMEKDNGEWLEQWRRGKELWLKTACGRQTGVPTPPSGYEKRDLEASNMHDVSI